MGPGPRTLVITRLRASDDQFEELWWKVVELAQIAGMEKIEVWNPASSLATTGHRLGSETVVREEHLPSLKWYGPESSEEVYWEFNER